MGKLFGTDGVRGVANSELTPELVMNLGKAGAFVLTKNKTTAPKILVATDSRRSGDMLTSALSAGLCSVGANVYLAGVVPTPAVAYLVRHKNFDAGVMISASHNPMGDNGIKFFDSSGYKLPDALENEIEDYMQNLDTLPRPTGAKVGIVFPYGTAGDDYIAYLLSIVDGLNLNSMKIALDCANGATSIVAPKVFQTLGAEVHSLFNSPNGLNINENCGSTHMESLSSYVKVNNMDLGIAFDGDGDRMLAVDSNGIPVQGDEILAIIGSSLKEQGKLAKDTIVATSMSNQGLEVMCKKHDITLLRTDVGDRYVLEKMLADNLTLGGEQSGHVIFKDHSTTGDGILTALKLVEIITKKAMPLAKLKTVMDNFPQVLVNVTIPNDKKRVWSENPTVMNHYKEIESKLADEGRILVRPSGTEPLVRVMIEGRHEEEIRKMANDLADTIKELLG